VSAPVAAAIESPEREIQRCLGYVAVLLAQDSEAIEQRLVRLDGARQWLEAALARVDALARDAAAVVERELAEHEDTQRFVAPRWRGRR
jgi:hypothetical protein